jgi:hypothetical protein
VGFVGSDLRTTFFGLKPPKGNLQAGTGIKVELNDTVDVFVDYDLEASRGYTPHNAALGLGLNF